jgi:hypothetical protein
MDKSYRLDFRFTESSTTFPRFPFGFVEITASVSSLVSCISGASSLILYVVTRFFTDGCFQAHRQVVLGISLPFALRMNFETLSIDLGCFPLNVQYLSTAVGLRSFFDQVYSQFTPNRYGLTRPHGYSALPPWPFERALLQQLS